MEKDRDKPQFRPNHQKVRRKFQNGAANTTENNGTMAAAGPSGYRAYHRNMRNDVRYGVGNKTQRNDRGAVADSKQNYEATQPIGSKTLEAVLKIENDAELILKLSSRKNGFLLLLDQNSIDSDMMCLILAALARVSNSSTELTMIQLLVHFYMEIIPKLCRNSNFHRELKLYIADLNKHLVVNSPQRDKHIEAVQHLLVFLRRLQTTVYLKSFDPVRDLMELITTQIEFINRKGNSLSDNIIDIMSQLNESLQNFEVMKKETEQIVALMEPPDDFRKISIHPDTFDILSNHEPFIRENVVDGRYVAGVDHYLDVQFRLLREDFVRPLRNGISEYRHIKSNPEQMAATKFRINDLNIYNKVRICRSEMIHNDQIYYCNFDITPFRHLLWQYNKRMISGSLVCFSVDDFETFFFATVAGQRDHVKLATGEFQIKLEMESAAMPDISHLSDYVMIESQVYFEAYRHNLKVLQDFGKDNFPLEKYIVDVDKNITPPSYLTDDTFYEISNGLTSTDPDIDVNSDSDTGIDPKTKMLPVNVLSQQWPPPEDLQFDESQYEAFRAALTKQMVVIQGPPGTGKTYVGLRIVEVLLANTSQWPILIVCYTNHALDQFLEGILKFCSHEKLVRIGGKSQCEALMKCNLSSIKSDMKNDRNVPTFIHRSRCESKDRLETIQEKISCLQNNLANSNRTILGYELAEVINQLNRNHYRQLQAWARNRYLDKGILNWLGYDLNASTNYNDNNEISNASNNAVKLTQVVTMDQEMDENEMKELEDQRFIDDNSDEESEVRKKVSSDPGTSREPINLDKLELLDYGDDSGSWRVHYNRGSIKQQIWSEMRKSETMSQEQATTVENINTLLPTDRWNLYRLWIKLYKQISERKIKDFREDYRTEYLRFNGLRQQEDIEIIKGVKIIGMTTTGAAKYRHIIDGTKPTITIVEEAAEVLEAHIVTALCKQTDHLILIGDHLQLRPNPAVYELAKKFKLEISLFERMINNRMEYYQLKHQHRMRPCISSLLVPHIYKQLLDHPSVAEYEDVKGISKNMFFLNHHQNEVSVEETRSRSNVYEAEFIVELCRYIILQGYETSQVTILTTYSGQLHRIRQLMRCYELLKDVRATVVDNYQGEECDIILLSFVRSNEEGNIGFLKDSHRVNVALSRARKGLYCIGNFDCLAEKSQLWQNLMSDLTAQQAIGDALEIFCQNHTDYKTLLKSKDDFKAAPDGGCKRPCGDRLPCGHSCEHSCHSIDREHMNAYKNCSKACDKIVCERGHRCPKVCHYDEECGECMVRVEKLRPQCGHIVPDLCSGDVLEARCEYPCEKVESPCGHTVNVNCSDVENDLILLNACTAPCEMELKCGHLCKGSCARCNFGRLHISCKEKCTRILICGHPCADICSVECGPCRKKCTNRCVHANCRFRCGEPCQPCKKVCVWRCEHLKCSKLCSEPCDRELCEHPSTFRIGKCKHTSIGVCGEKTPRLCRICNKQEVEKIFSGNGDEKDTRFIELNDCKHVFEVKELVRSIQSEPEESAESNSASVGNNRAVQLKECPKCKTSIRNTRALNTFIQASLSDFQKVKLKTRGNRNENRITQSALYYQINDILHKESKSFEKDPLHLRSFYENILEEVRFSSKSTTKILTLPKSNRTLIQLKNKLKLLEVLRKIWREFEGSQGLQRNLSTEMIKKFERRLQMAVSFITDYTNCDQQRADISNEISFLRLMCAVFVSTSMRPFNDTGMKLLNDAFTLAHQYGSATEIVRNKFKEIVNEAWKNFSRITIPMDEKEIVLKAMRFTRGDWYKCPNGHVYAIGECGATMQKSICPECEKESGQNRRLGRAHASSEGIGGDTAAARSQMRPPKRPSIQTSTRPSWRTSMRPPAQLSRLTSAHASSTGIDGATAAATPSKSTSMRPRARFQRKK